MTTYLGKSCSFGALRKLPSIYVFSCFHFGFEGRMWDLIVSVPDHCLSFYFSSKLRGTPTKNVKTFNLFRHQYQRKMLKLRKMFIYLKHETKCVK